MFKIEKSSFLTTFWLRTEEWTENSQFSYQTELKLAILVIITYKVIITSMAPRKRSSAATDKISYRWTSEAKMQVANYLNQHFSTFKVITPKFRLHVQVKLT